MTDITAARPSITERLALVDRIKDAFRACKTVTEVNTTAKHFGFDVAKLEREGGDLRTMAIQIRNLAVWKRKMLTG